MQVFQFHERSIGMRSNKPVTSGNVSGISPEMVTTAQANRGPYE